MSGVDWGRVARELGWESVQEGAVLMALAADRAHLAGEGRDENYLRHAADRLRAVSEKEESNERPLG